MVNKSIKKNYIYNLSYQLLLVIMPLVTTPYISRVLGADGVGEVSFAQSVVSYFTLFAVMGMTTYGQREISFVQDDKEKRTEIFWEIKMLQVITSVFVFAIYIFFALTQNNNILYLILSINIIAILVDVAWLLQGMEEFGKIVLRNIIFKALTIIYIFTVVKTKADIIKYVWGNAFFLFLSNVSLWIYVPRYIGKPNLGKINPFRNLKEVLFLFIPSIAIQVYTVFDKTMIGIITKSTYENGYYEQAVLISKFALTIVTSLGTVMIPRIGYYFGRKENKKIEYYMYRGYQFVWFLGIPLSFGLAGTADNFVPWFLGEEFQKVIPLLKILTLLIPIIGISNVTGMQYLIPSKREKLFTITVLIGASVNFFLNLLLITWFQSIGAAIASVTAEALISLIQLYFVRKELSFNKIMKSSINYLFASIVMFIFLKGIGISVSSSIIHSTEMIIGGIFIYFMILICIKDSFFTENVVSVYKRKK